MNPVGDFIYPSFITGTITQVNAKNHSVNIQCHRFAEELVQVPLFRNPSGRDLPQKGDIAIVIFDNRLHPIVIGFYPKFISNQIDTNEVYPLQEGEILLQSSFGGRLMMLQNGVMRFSNWLDQGIEIDGNSGSFILRSPSKKDTFHGVVERSGWIRRKSVVGVFGAASLFELDNLESVIQKIGDISSPGSIVTDTAGGQETFEKRLEIKIPGSQTAATPNGINLIEETIGTGIIPNDPTGLAYTETLSSQSALPLRKKTIYYDPTGTTELLTEEIDCNGNLKLFISPTASMGINIDAVVPALLSLLNLTVNATGQISLNGSMINLNGSTDNVVLATMLSTIFNEHVHTYDDAGTPSVTLTPLVPMVPSSVSSLTVKAT